MGLGVEKVDDEVEDRKNDCGIEISVKKLCTKIVGS